MARAARQSGADPDDEDYEEFEEMLEQAEDAQVRVAHAYISVMRTNCLAISYINSFFSRSFTQADKYKEYFV